MRPFSKTSCCAVRGCPSNRSQLKGVKDEISFHEFPRCEAQCTEWIRFCDNAHLELQVTPEQASKERYSICSLHFEANRLKKCKKKDGTEYVKLLPKSLPTLRGPEENSHVTEILVVVAECAVNGCESNRGKTKEKCTHHRFPQSDPEIFQKWIEFCQNPKLSKLSPEDVQKKRFAICEGHFEELCYVEGKKKRVLFRDSIPTLKGPLISDSNGLLVSPVKKAANNVSRVSSEGCGPVVNFDDDCNGWVMQDCLNLEQLANACSELDSLNGSEYFLSDNMCGVEEFNSSELKEQTRLTHPSKVANPKPSGPMSRAKRLAFWNEGSKEPSVESLTGIYKDLFHRTGRMSDHPTDMEKLCFKLTHRVKQLEVENLRLRHAETTKKESKPVAVAYAKECLNEKQFELVRCLLDNAQKRPKGRRYSQKAKVIFLGLYLFDPRAYANMRAILGAIPCENTLRNMLAQNKVEEGFLPFVFQALRCCTKDFSDLAKYVILSWDAINLSPELHYIPKADGNGHLGGLDSQSKQPATQANVLMLKSIYGDFKLPLAYFLHDSKLDSEKVVKKVDEAIELVFDTGLILKGVVCDQAPAHQKIFKDHFKVTPEKPYFERRKTKIYCFFDPPHLLKSVKANLKKNVVIYEDVDADGNKVEKRASWAHVIGFFENDIKKTSRVAPKLTDNHIYGSPVTNMNVALAAQVFSRTVAAGIEKAVKKGVLPQEALDTARMLRLFNDLFDSCNGKHRKKKDKKNKGKMGSKMFPKVGVRNFEPPSSDPLYSSEDFDFGQYEADEEAEDVTHCDHSYLAAREKASTATSTTESDDKEESTDEEDKEVESINQLASTNRRPLKFPATKKSPHHSVWKEATEMIKTMQFFRGTTHERFTPPCLYGWQLTISAFQHLWAELEELKISTLPTGAFNQDFVENFFSQVRYRNGSPDVTPRAFRNVFKFLTVYHVMDPSRGKNPNCIMDDSRYLEIFGDENRKKLDALLPTEPAKEDNENSEEDNGEDVAEVEDLVETASEEAEVEDVEVEEVEIEEVKIISGDGVEGAENYVASENPNDVKYSSYLARRLIQKSRHCATCESNYSVFQEQRGKQHDILCSIENKASSYALVASQESFQLFVYKVSERFLTKLKECYGDPNLGLLLAGEIKSTQSFDYVLGGCTEHADLMKTFFVQIVTSSLMRHLTKHQNASLQEVIKASRRKTKVATLATSHKIFSGDEMKDALMKNFSYRPPARKPKTLKKKKDAKASDIKAAEELEEAYKKKYQRGAESFRHCFLMSPAPEVPAVLQEVTIDNANEAEDSGISGIEVGPFFTSTPKPAHTKRKLGAAAEQELVQMEKRVKPSPTQSVPVQGGAGGSLTGSTVPVQQVVKRVWTPLTLGLNRPIAPTKQVVLVQGGAGNNLGGSRGLLPSGKAGAPQPLANFRTKPSPTQSVPVQGGAGGSLTGSTLPVQQVVKRVWTPSTLGLNRPIAPTKQVVLVQGGAGNNLGGSRGLLPSGKAGAPQPLANFRTKPSPKQVVPVQGGAGGSLTGSTLPVQQVVKRVWTPSTLGLNRSTVPPNQVFPVQGGAGYNLGGSNVLLTSGKAGAPQPLANVRTTPDKPMFPASGAGSCPLEPC